MKPNLLKLLMFILLASPTLRAQDAESAAVLKVLFNKYYANEKVIVPGRMQLLSFYCQKSPNNEEVLEVIKKCELLKKHSAEIKKQISAPEESWQPELDLLFGTENQYLKRKVNACLSLEEFQVYAKKLNLNNQRLMIVGKPIFFGADHALIKVTFYRNIEHNSGSFFVLEKSNTGWIIKETLNAWST